MPQFSMPIVAAIAVIGLALAAQAYGTDPAENTLPDISKTAYNVQGEDRIDGVCQIKITPDLAEIMGFSTHWRTHDARFGATVACHADN